MDDAFDLPSERSWTFFLSIRGVIHFAFLRRRRNEPFRVGFPLRPLRGSIDQGSGHCQTGSTHASLVCAGTFGRLGRESSWTGRSILVPDALQRLAEEIEAEFKLSLEIEAGLQGYVDHNFRKRISVEDREGAQGHRRRESRPT